MCAGQYTGVKYQELMKILIPHYDRENGIIGNCEDFNKSSPMLYLEWCCKINAIIGHLNNWNSIVIKSHYMLMTTAYIMMQLYLPWIQMV